MSPEVLILANLFVAAGAWVQGSVGFGLALVSAPLLAMLAPGLVPGPLMAATFVILVLTVLREKTHVDKKGIGWMLAGRVPGSIVGALTLAQLSFDTLGLLIGILILLAVLLSAISLRLERSWLSLTIAGIVSGFMATTASIGGPAVAILYQHDQGPMVRSSLGAYFVLGSCISFLALFAVGRFGLSELTAGGLLVPGVLLGFALSARTGAYLDQGRTRVAVLFVAGASGIAAILQALL